MMGEYATLRSTGSRVKIGTCENMYYLRADQAHLVQPEEGNVDPVRERDAIRFRFPWPDEDAVAPGDFDDHAKSLTVWGAVAPEIDHSTVQFTARNGYLVSLPCPEGAQEVPYHVHRNGYGGAVAIVQQRYWEGLLVTVCECKGCGAKYRLETVEMAEEVAVLLRAMADKGQGVRSPLHEIADRMLAGYALVTT